MSLGMIITKPVGPKADPFRGGKLPQWARANPVVVARCAKDVAYRMRVLSSEKHERAALAAEAG